jgi:hypothetical protein
MIVGALIIAAIFVCIFVITAKISGWLAATVIWGGALVLTGIVYFGVALLTGVIVF